jgi:hypothetical protein
VLRLFALASNVVPLHVLLPALTVGSLVWLAVELARATSQVIGPARFAAAFVMAAAFGGVGAPALMSGNLAPTMDFALMAALLRGRRDPGALSRYLPYALILLFALVKPYFLLFLAAPVILYERRVVALLCGVIVTAMFAAIWLSFQAYWPSEYAQFLANLRWHILGRGDLGYTFFYVFGALTRKVDLALTLHVFVSLLLLALVPMLFARKYGPAKAPFVPQLMVLHLALTLANPRMKDYDLFPALVGFFAVFGLLSRASERIILAGLSLAAVPLLGSVFPAVSARHPILFDPFGNWQIVGLAVIAVLFLVGMLEETPQMPQPA